MKNKLLIDTHVLLWAADNDRRLGSQARELLQTTSNVFVSAISILEIRIKQSTGKLRLPQDIDEIVSRLDISVLDLNPNDCAAYSVFNPKNRDPFDNAVLAVAAARHMHLLSADKRILRVGGSTIRITDAAL